MRYGLIVVCKYSTVGTVSVFDTPFPIIVCPHYPISSSAHQLTQTSTLLTHPYDYCSNGQSAFVPRHWTRFIKLHHHSLPKLSPLFYPPF